VIEAVLGLDFECGRNDCFLELNKQHKVMEEMIINNARIVELNKIEACRTIGRRNAFIGNCEASVETNIREIR